MTWRGSFRASLCVAVAASIAACGHKEQEAPPVGPVQVAPAIRGSIRHIVTADAVLYPRDQANIVPKISAPVQKFLVNRGDHVKQGQLLAVLENRDLAGSAEASRGQYEQAQANYRSTAAATVPEEITKAQADLEAARQTLAAAKHLIDSREELFKEGALPRKSVDEAQVGYAQAKGQFDTAQQHLDALQKVGKEEQLKAAAAQLQSAKGQYASAQAQVAYSEIRSPLRGVVTDRPLYVGEMANTGAPLLTVMDRSSVVARTNMAQDQARAVKVGAEATLAPADGSEPIAGKVIIVSPAVDPNTTTVQVWVQAENPGGRLRAGTSVHVSIVAETLDGVTLIPATAVFPSDEGGTVAKVVDDKDTAHEKKIAVGVKEGDLVQVVSGLTPGERVVTVGGLGLEDKAKVRIMKPGEKAAGDEEKDEKDEK